MSSFVFDHHGRECSKAHLLSQNQAQTAIEKNDPELMKIALAKVLTHNLKDASGGGWDIGCGQDASLCHPQAMAS